MNDYMKQCTYPLMEYVPYGSKVKIINAKNRLNLETVFIENDYIISSCEDYEYNIGWNIEVDEFAWLYKEFKPFAIYTKLDIWNHRIFRDIVNEAQEVQPHSSPIQMLILNERKIPFGDITFDSYITSNNYAWLCRWILPKDIMIENV